MPTEIEIAWAAGLFEGEGCFSSGGKHPFRPRAIMSSTDEDVIRKFAKIVGVGTIVPIPPRKETHKFAWQWYTTEKDFHVVANMLKPYLGVRRKQAIEDTIRKRNEYIKLKTQLFPCKVCGAMFNRVFYKGKPLVFCSETCRKKRKPDGIQITVAPTIIETLERN